MKMNLFNFKRGLLALLIIICSLVFLHGCDIFLHNMAKRDAGDDPIGLDSIGGPGASHNIDFDLNGGTGTPISSQSGPPNANVVFPTPDNGPDGKIFDNWNTQADGSGDDEYKESDKNVRFVDLLPDGGTITLYAIWI